MLKRLTFTNIFTIKLSKVCKIYGMFEKNCMSIPHIRKHTIFLKHSVKVLTSLNILNKYGFELQS